MRKISRSRRAQIQRHAQQVRQQGLRAGWSVARIAAAILSDLPGIHPLEACRLAHGWSRPQVIELIADLYRGGGLAAPAINSSMLCRWEHEDARPGIEYCQVLCRLYDVAPDQLGLRPASPVVVPPLGNGFDGRGQSASTRTANEWSHVCNGYNGETLAAVWESILFAVEVEGPSGGPLVRDQLDQAVEHYALNYARFPPGLLAAEVHRCRGVVTAMLRHDQSPISRSELHRLAGWLSALLGNLAFHLGEYTSAKIHLGIAAALGADIGHNRLIAWTRGAQSMLTRYQNRPAEALKLACQAVEHADTPLGRSQMVAWAELPALARLGRHGEARDAIIRSQREMDISPEQDVAGRFGFDAAELELHLAEAELELGNATAAAVHAQASLGHVTVGRPGWAAAILTLARSEAQRRRPDQGAELALHVLQTIPASSLRKTSRQRLARLDDYFTELGRPGPAATDLHERLRTSVSS